MNWVVYYFGFFTTPHWDGVHGWPGQHIPLFGEWGGQHGSSGPGFEHDGRVGGAWNEIDHPPTSAFV
jgi:hypothetical protein